jgi:hypothetical protein
MSIDDGHKRPGESGQGREPRYNEPYSVGGKRLQSTANRGWFHPAFLGVCGTLARLTGWKSGSEVTARGDGRDMNVSRPDLHTLNPLG